MEEVRIVVPKVGTEPLVIVQVDITKTIVEETNVQKVVEYIHFIFVILQGFQNEIQSVKGVILRGQDDYMIWMNRAFRIGYVHGAL